MANVIYKYQLDPSDEQVVEMPANARILSAHEQRGMPHIWAVVDPDSETEKRKILMRGTGHAAPPASAPFIGTVFHGPFVWHIFDGGAETDDG